MARAIIICLDGCGPDYLDAAPTPCLDRLAKRGFSTVARSVVPTVTNVNNASIATGSFPDTHGITGNYTYDPASGTETYMESSSFMPFSITCLLTRYRFAIWSFS